MCSDSVIETMSKVYQEEYSPMSKRTKKAQLILKLGDIGCVTKILMDFEASQVDRKNPRLKGKVVDATLHTLTRK